MSNQPASGKGTCIPCLRYRNAHAAIEWLCRNLGFEKHLVVDGEGDQVAHAQLALGAGMVMIGSAGDAHSEYGKLVRQPDQLGGFQTQSPYVVVSDADAVYRKVKEDGGRIVIDIKDEDYGGRGFSVLDPEGHLWNVGTYDPWNVQPGAP
jgi:uncharacterized glyoxalase superfamily protein PhnB